MRCLAEYDLTSEVGLMKDATVLKIQHPNNLYTASIKRSDAPCQEDRCALRVWIEFDSEELQESKDISDKHLSDIMNTLALTTSGSVGMIKINRIIDWTTPGMAERDALFFVHSKATDAPFDLLNQDIADSIGSLLPHCDNAHVKRAMRWFRSALDQEINDDVFHCFWRAIEVLAPLFRENEQISDKCTRCHSPLYCEKCQTHPTHKPYPKQVIEEMISHESRDDGTTFKKLYEVRNGLAHGEALNTLVSDDEEKIKLINVVGQLALIITCRAMAKTTGEIHFTGSMASTYAKSSMGACARIRTVFPVGEDGLPIPSGVQISLTRSESPEDEHPTLIQLRMRPDPSKTS